jgi:hypothetical protein
MSLATIESAPSAPIVRTTASPPAALLMNVRALVARDEDLKGFFVQFKRENKTVEWLRDVVATPISCWVDDQWDLAQVVEACQYLADEYNQLPEGFLMVNRETGKVEAVFSEDDLMDPGLLPRESGGMAQALQRLRPDREVALVTYQHQAEREEKVLQALVERSNGAIQSTDDFRLRMATRKGRTAIARDLSTDDPRELLRRSGGTSGALLRHFPLVDEKPEEPTLEGGATCRRQIGVQDALSINTGYNQLGTLRAIAPQSWVRSICLDLSKRAHDKFQVFPQDVQDLDPEVLRGSELWICDPDTYVVLKPLSPKTPIMVLEGIAPIGLSGDIGKLFLGDEMSVETHERFKRWEVVASVGYALVVEDWDKIQVLNLLGVAAHAEVVQ